MKVYIVILLLALFALKNGQCQNADNMIQEGKLWVLVKKEKMKSNDQKNEYQPESKIVLEIFNKYKVYKMKYDHRES
jgi:hypothetical protein